MGFPPPPDLPPPVPPALPANPLPTPPNACLSVPTPTGSLLPGGLVGIGINFDPTVGGYGLCGFKLFDAAYLASLLAINLNYSFKLPKLDFPPQLFFALCLKCDLSDPIDGSFGFGGGREPGPNDPNKDPEFPDA